MESGQKSLSELRSRLLASDGQAFVRLVVDAGLRTVWYLDAIAGAPAEPPGWQEQVWRYADVLFIATSVPYATLAAALDSESGGTLAPGRTRDPLPCLAGTGVVAAQAESRPARVGRDPVAGV